MTRMIIFALKPVSYESNVSDFESNASVTVHR